MVKPRRIATFLLTNLGSRPDSAHKGNLAEPTLHREGLLSTRKGLLIFSNKH